MIKSMTAYARAEHRTPPDTVRIEVRGFNSRHLDIALRLTHGFEALEARIRGAIAACVARGRVDLRVQIQDDSDPGGLFTVNLPRAQAYHEALQELKGALNLTEPIRIDALLAGGGMVEAVEVEKDVERVWPLAKACLESALADLETMRCAEGDHIAQDFRERLDRIEGMLQQIGDQAGQLPEMIRRRLVERIDALTHGAVEIDATRIAQEAALLADRSDISEEIVRVHSHIKQFRALMAGDAPAGRPLNFLLQEINREFNTMGSKAGQADMAHLIVAVKSELEKLREQVQNVE